MREPHLSADIDAVAELIRRFQLGGLHMTPQNCGFVAGALDKLAFEARTLEAELEREESWRQAADARVEALTTPDHLTKTRREIAINEGRRAGVVVDLRPYLDREWTRAPNDSVADASSDEKDTVAAVASDGGNGDAA
ncbi:hypothetical protein F7D13_07070 [Methylocystis rosea]|uniref:Uncharacterized protein n=1 Tax=Methylocystis rosea TaxID=173366 RepID=A0ABX6EHD9_9HYPH|nr:hypothetical protein [Methylocystis rosea]QGM93804.1 hypothetical protein F7D13_07070 [Methylocystis rosea]